MKKFIILAVCMLFFMCGCDMNLNNTPVKQAEIFLNKYQMLHGDVLSDLDNKVAEEELFNKIQRETYKSIMKKHYQDLEYEIKEDLTNGDVATVTVEIEVNDYSKIDDKISKVVEDNPKIFLDEEGIYSYDKYLDYKFQMLKKENDRVKYTLILNFIKKNGKWEIMDLSSDDMDKINGMYIK